MTLLFSEPGGRWRSAAFGPVLCGAGALTEVFLGGVVHWLTWILVAPLLGGITALGVLGARRHGVVALSPACLRQGTEELTVADIAVVFAEPANRAWDDPVLDWELARALGESFSVPRRHTGIGLQLADGRLVQAWARDAVALRAALRQVIA